MVFGRSKEEKQQDKTLKNLAKTLNVVVKNQNAIIANQNYILKNSDNHWAWIQHLDKNTKALQVADVKFKQADMEFDKRLSEVGASLYNAAKQKSEVVESEGEAQE